MPKTNHKETRQNKSNSSKTQTVETRRLSQLSKKTDDAECFSFITKIVEGEKSALADNMFDFSINAVLQQPTTARSNQERFIDEHILSGTSIQSEPIPRVTSSQLESLIMAEHYDLLNQLLDKTIEKLENKTSEVKDIRSEISDLLSRGIEDTNVVGIK